MRKTLFSFYQCNKEDDCKKNLDLSHALTLYRVYKFQVRADQSSDLCARTPDPLQPVSSAISPFTLSFDPKPIDSPLREKKHIYSVDKSWSVDIFKVALDLGTFYCCLSIEWDGELIIRSSINIFLSTVYHQRQHFLPYRLYSVHCTVYK